MRIGADSLLPKLSPVMASSFFWTALGQMAWPLVALAAVVLVGFVGLVLWVLLRSNRQSVKDDLESPGGEVGAFEQEQIEKAMHESIEIASQPEWESLPPDALRQTDPYFRDPDAFAYEEEKKELEEVDSPLIESSRGIRPAEIEMQQRVAAR